MITGTRSFFRSTDHGKSWIFATPETQIAPVYAVAAIGNTVFLATDGLLVSTDMGISWQPGPSPSTDGVHRNMIGTLLVDGGTLYAGVWGGGVWRSTDTGQSWTSITGYDSLHTTVVSRSYALAKIGSHIFAATEKGVCMSPDNGDTWIPRTNGLPPDKQTLAISLTAGNKLLFVRILYGDLFFSSDEGLHWTNIMESSWAGLAWPILATKNSILVDCGAQGLQRRQLSDFQNLSVKVDRDQPFSLSPNPVTNFVTVSQAAHVTITNMLGRNVLDVTNHDHNNLTLDVSKLPPGAYFVRSDDSQALKKLIKE